MSFIIIICTIVIVAIRINTGVTIVDAVVTATALLQGVLLPRSMNFTDTRMFCGICSSNVLLVRSPAFFTIRQALRLPNGVG